MTTTTTNNTPILSHIMFDAGTLSPLPHDIFEKNSLYNYNPHDIFEKNSLYNYDSSLSSSSWSSSSQLKGWGSTKTRKSYLCLTSLVGNGVLSPRKVVPMRMDEKGWGYFVDTKRNYHTVPVPTAVLHREKRLASSARAGDRYARENGNRQNKYRGYTLLC